MTNKTKTLEDIKQELSQSEHDFLVKQKKELAKTIAETYKNWKTDVKGMSQAHFAELIETSQPRVSNIINGKVDHFTIDKLLSFCIRLNIKSQLHSKPLKNMKHDTRVILDSIKESDAA